MTRFLELLGGVKLGEKIIAGVAAFRLEALDCENGAEANNR